MEYQIPITEKEINIDKLKVNSLKIEHLIIPKHIKEIPDEVFEMCVNLKKITINSDTKFNLNMLELYDNLELSINDIENFDMSKRYYIHNGINITSENGKIYEGVIYNNDYTKLLYYPENKEDLEYILLNSCKEIGPCAIINDYIEKIVLSPSIEKINERGICACSSLKEIEFNDNLETIEKNGLSSLILDNINLFNTKVKKISDIFENMYVGYLAMPLHINDINELINKNFDIKILEQLIVTQEKHKNKFSTITDCNIVVEKITLNDLLNQGKTFKEATKELKEINKEVNETR